MIYSAVLDLQVTVCSSYAACHFSSDLSCISIVACQLDCDSGVACQLGGGVTESSGPSAGPRIRCWKSLRRRQKLFCQANTEQQPQYQGPDISQLKPHLQQQWDAAANGRLGNIVIKPFSNRKVQWVCQECPLGHAHVWQATVVNRSNGKGCPYCAGRAVCQHNSLATQFPQVAAEWDFDANPHTPHDIASRSRFKVAWRCNTCNHPWRATVQSRTGLGSGCPACGFERAKMQSKNPSLAAAGLVAMAYWDHERNGQAGLDPARITLGSNKPVHWVCGKCPLGHAHRWEQSPNARKLAYKSPTGCPCCVGKKVCKCNSLQTLCPELATEWDFSKNDTTPADHTASTQAVVWWLLPGRSWRQSIDQRTQNVNKRNRRLAAHKQLLDP